MQVMMVSQRVDFMCMHFVCFYIYILACCSVQLISVVKH